MSEEECIHGLGPVSACVICNGRAAREDKETQFNPTLFKATYQSRCVRCGKKIEVDDDLAWRSGEGPAVHEECWDVG